jgi:hypothetical protein
LAGFDVPAHVTRDALGSGVSVSLAGVPRTTLEITFAELRDMPPLGLLTRVENLAGDLESRASAATERAEQARRDSARASARIGQHFEHTDRVAFLRARLVEIDRELAPPEPADHESLSGEESRPEVLDLVRAVSGALSRRRQWGPMAPSTVGQIGAEPRIGPDISL